MKHSPSIARAVRYLSIQIGFEVAHKLQVPKLAPPVRESVGLRAKSGRTCGSVRLGIWPESWTRAPPFALDWSLTAALGLVVSRIRKQFHMRIAHADIRPSHVSPLVRSRDRVELCSR